MAEFAILPPLLGGVLIGLAAVLLMALQGRIAGISGILARLLPPRDRGEAGPALGFALGLVAAPLLAWAVLGEKPAQAIAAPLWLMPLAGLLTGFGAVWGSGCTSGHGVCGLARLSPRSAVAVALFMAAAFATVFLRRHLLGGVA
ncbi:YeeE/YedE family protein [Pseudoroseomonas cervicalis]|uniref:YeeE/YedE family protein n=1 Tax=Pseudoroseomonas cervicalis ATCC 49957 TaxID=525371 RepID=D5RJH5_9PROT|nr:YeeE/YedE thiosulfate transporter family protein [Pseudoroseomonas cervicalis]EFH12541.1 YeeE/YedE family protein [Pseudoroseomonas cervicalis ATCC 49957]